MRADDLMDAWEAAWSGRDPLAFAPLCAPDVQYEDPLCPAPLLGASALAEHVGRLWDAFSDVRVERSGARLTDERFVAAPVHIAGFNDGRLGDLPPTRRAVELQALFYCQVEGGRLRRVRTFVDLADAARQLGVLP